jgi:hypothetical protein
MTFSIKLLQCETCDTVYSSDDRSLISNCVICGKEICPECTKHHHDSLSTCSDECERMSLLLQNAQNKKGGNVK